MLPFFMHCWTCIVLSCRSESCHARHSTRYALNFIPCNQTHHALSAIREEVRDAKGTCAGVDALPAYPCCTRAQQGSSEHGNRTKINWRRSLLTLLVWHGCTTWNGRVKLKRSFVASSLTQIRRGKRRRQENERSRALGSINQSNGSIWRVVKANSIAHCPHARARARANQNSNCKFHCWTGQQTMTTFEHASTSLTQ